MLHELLRQADGYLIGRTTLHDFEDYLLAGLQHILDSGNSQAIEMANKLDVDLMLLGEGEIDQAEFRDRVETYVRDYSTDRILCFSVSPVSSVTSTTGGTVNYDWRVLNPVEDYRQMMVAMG